LQPGEVPTLARHRRQPFSRWIYVSGALFIAFAACLLFLFTDDSFYVRSIQVRGQHYTSAEELFAYSQLDGYHLLWLDTAELRRNVLQSPLVADLSVELGWPPHLLTLHIQERQPALVWVESGEETWLDIQGRVMPARSEMPHLLQVHALGGIIGLDVQRAEDFGRGRVLGALRLQEILPEGARMFLHPAHGLGWTNERGWQVWMGSGDGKAMDEKINSYRALLGDLTRRAVNVAELNIVNADAPFYKRLQGT